MPAEAGIGDRDVYLVPAGVAGLVPPEQEDGSSYRVEGEQDSPRFARDLDAEFFHITEPGALDAVNVRTPEARAEHLKQAAYEAESVLSP